MSFPSSPSPKIRLVWHRKGDLRLHDNELYHVKDVEEEAVQIVSLFVINPKDYQPRAAVCGKPKRKTGSEQDDPNPLPLETVTEGPHASRALIQALDGLRKNLQKMGGTLLVRRGDPLQIVPEIAERVQANEIMWSQVPGYYERQLSEQMLQSIVQKSNPNTTISRVKTVAGYFLWHPDDLPRDEQTWSRLARPKEQKSKKRGISKTNDAVTSGSTASPDATLVGHHQNLNIEVVDCCSSSRWRGIPRIMGDFRRAARTVAGVRSCLAPPSSKVIHNFPFHVADINEEEGEIPTLSELTKSYQGRSLFGLPHSIIDSIIRDASDAITEQRQSTCPFGETAARKHWENFLEKHAATADRSLADTSTSHQSAHISTFLALGMLSPRHIYWSVLEEQQKKNQIETKDSIQWLRSHMEMRDYFMYSALAADQKLYNRQGQSLPVHKSKQRRHANNKKQSPSDEKQQQKQQQQQQEQNGYGQEQDPTEWKDPESNLGIFSKWATGNTGLPLVDAGMKEMMSTGYCSNRVRQNMASVLTKDLHLDWRIGAEWFQFCLIDHCVAANWGNWQYFGGVGGDPKNRHFRTVSQAIRYDPHGSYVQKWLLQLRDLLATLEDPSMRKEACFRPWDIFDTSWNTTIVNPMTQYTWQDKQRLEETGKVL